MPTYEYICQKCEHEFEVFQSMKEKPLSRCPRKACGGKVRRKLGLGAGVIFKGSGFYITDYRSDSYKKAAKAESGGGAEKTGAGTEAKSEPAAGKSDGKSPPATSPAKVETSKKADSAGKKTGGT